MSRFILRRLVQAIFTIFGVMIVTFLLFRVMAGDIAAAHVGAKATEQAKATWRHQHGYDRPLVVNVHSRIRITDKTVGEGRFLVLDAQASTVADKLALVPSDDPGESDRARYGRYILGLGRTTPIRRLTGDKEVTGKVEVETASGHKFTVNEIEKLIPSLNSGRIQIETISGNRFQVNQVTRFTPRESRGELQIETVDGHHLHIDSIDKRDDDVRVYAEGQSFAIDEINRLLAGKPEQEVSKLDTAGMGSEQFLDALIEWLVGGTGIDGTLDLQTLSGAQLTVELAGITKVGGLLDRINAHTENQGTLVVADIVKATLSQAFDSQFFDHLYRAATFQSRSLKDNQKLTDIIVKRAPNSLALTVPAMAMGWLVAMVISCFVAYYRNTLIDKIGVFLSVLGMCVPFLAWMIIGQWLMFEIAPLHAYGLAHRGNIYVPITIMVIAGLGGSVRFYRTIILDEINRDYVRTARAKGVSLPSILFKHVLKNCMLPILTNLILAIPFLIMGSLLVESYFGIPGLGDLMLSSINGRDEPVMSGLVFLSAVIYTIGLLITDISYAVFDPRIRLQ